MLCLAQISNTLLKNFNCNEIHNCRVALGITCIQCNPEQLDVLRRYGIMPIASRRCGMISIRASERLVCSFFEEHNTPKLPDSFTFSVLHNCGWGCRGRFVPARYNSSTSKCIECTYCDLYLSLNKFIFHFHETLGAEYRHLDATNFNFWRTHLVLDYAELNDELVHAWEDVKAMFNGGSRKKCVPRATCGTNPRISILGSCNDSEVRRMREEQPIVNQLNPPPNSSYAQDNIQQFAPMSEVESNQHILSLPPPLSLLSPFLATAAYSSLPILTAVNASIHERYYGSMHMLELWSASVNASRQSNTTHPPLMECSSSTFRRDAGSVQKQESVNSSLRQIVVKDCKNTSSCQRCKNRYLKSTVGNEPTQSCRYKN